MDIATEQTFVAQKNCIIHYEKPQRKHRKRLLYFELRVYFLVSDKLFCETNLDHIHCIPVYKFVSYFHCGIFHFHKIMQIVSLFSLKSHRLR